MGSVHPAPPGIGGGKTGAPEDADRGRVFMMRVRSGRAADRGAVAHVAGIAKEYGRDLADITDRQNVQLHWIRIEDVPQIWQRLEGVGLSSLQACGDAPRNILGCPVAGIDAGESSTPPRCCGRPRRCRGQPEFINLPRKYKTAIGGARPSAPRTRSTTSLRRRHRPRRHAPASTCGWAAGCPPTRCSPGGSACSWPRTGSRRCGAGSPVCSATTATGGCAAGRG